MCDSVGFIRPCHRTGDSDLGRGLCPVTCDYTYLPCCCKRRWEEQGELSGCLRVACDSPTLAMLLQMTAITIIASPGPRCGFALVQFCDFCDDLHIYRQDCGVVFTQRQIIRFFCPAGVTRCTDQVEGWQGRGPVLPVKLYPDHSRDVGLRPPKLLKIWNFTNIIAPKGRVPCAILTKFRDFMRVFSLHNSAKFGWFCSVNN